MFVLWLITQQRRVKGYVVLWPYVANSALPGPV